MKKMLLVIIFLILPSLVLAVPVLQVGAPAVPGEGTNDYADYIDTLTNPTEEDTAVTYGNTLYVAGVYANNVANLGGQYSNGDNWSDFEGPAEEGSLPFPSDFNAAGAVLVASIPDGSLLNASTFTLQIIDSSSSAIDYFYSSEEFSYFPNNHDPLKDDVSDFLFFDIGDFLKVANAVPNFDEYDTDYDPNDKKAGEIKEFTLNISGLDWVHFDVMALQTKENNQTELISTLVNNPGSHDLTWKYDDGGGGGGGGDPIPEPSTLILLGAGIVGLAVYRRKKN